MQMEAAYSSARARRMPGGVAAHGRRGARQRDSEVKMEVERIKFERTGGFAGMTIARDLKLDDLSEEQAAYIIGIAR